MNRPAPDSTRTTGDPARSAAPLDELVCAALGQRVRGLRIEVREGGLVLRGLADSDHVKLLAQYAVMAVTGLPLMTNKIEVTFLERERSQRGGAESAKGEARPPKSCVLLATRDDRLRSNGRHYLADHGYAVTTAADGLECVAFLRELGVAVAVLDTDLLWGGADGVLAHLRAGDDAQTTVVLLSSRSAARRGCGKPVASPVVSVIAKPIVMTTLLWAVRLAAGEGAASDPEA